MGSTNRVEAGKQQWRAELVKAVEAAGRGDVKAEEEAIQRARRIAVEVSSKTWFGAPAREFDAEILGLINTGQVRRGCQDIGTVGEFVFFADRIVTGDGSVVLPDSEMEASVHTAGSLTTTQRPTLTRMAAGALLPGSALIPGFAFQKKTTQDNRQLYFMVEHPDWGIFQELNPALEAVVRQVAMGINQVAGQLKRAAEARGTEVTASMGSSSDPLEQLRKLGELRDAGVVTSEEFEAKKAELLGRL